MLSAEEPPTARSRRSSLLVVFAIATGIGLAIFGSLGALVSVVVTPLLSVEIPEWTAWDTFLSPVVFGTVLGLALTVRVSPTMIDASKR